MTVLDAYALLAYLLDSDAADDVQPLLGEDDPATISALNLAEVVDRLVRVTGLEPAEVAASLEPLLDTGVTVVSVTKVVGMDAGRLRARHCRKRQADVSMADCVACSTALGSEQTLATADPALAAMARAEGVQVVALPDSLGRRP
ncbi:MAG: PIN domain-containing protein [Candidatus Dormibacteraeota bacterium]|nr:PIN domain-containing protein [Candidatus Dormibacteraeota bacterium]